MSKYVETPIAAAVYQRSHCITITNPYQAYPVVTFEEEQLIKREDGTVFHDVLRGPHLTKIIDDYGYEFPVYNPLTQQKTGQTSTAAQVYAIIWSVYMFEATKRDAQKAKDKVLSVFEASALAALDTAHVAAAAVRDQFAAQDAMDYAEALDAADAAPTQEFKDAIMVAYETSKAQKKADSEAAANKAVSDQLEASAVLRVQAVIDAQAAYDRVMAA